MLGPFRLALVCQLFTAVACGDDALGTDLADGAKAVDIVGRYSDRDAQILKPSGSVDRGLEMGAVNTYLLYSIPPFIAHMSFRAGTGDVSEYQAISRKIADVTTDFLTTYFLSDLKVRAEYEGSSAQFHSIELDVAVRRGVTKRGSRRLMTTRVLQTVEDTIEIRSEFTGEAIFNDLSFVTEEGTAATVTEGNYGRFRVNQDVVRSIVTAAFSDNTQSSPYLRRLQRSSNNLLAGILSVTVQTNTDRRTGSSSPGSSNGNDGGASVSPAGSNSDDQGYERMSRGEGLAILFMGTFLLFFFAGFYIYLSREHHSQMKLERAYARHYGRRGRMNSKERQLSADTLAMDETDSYEDEFEVEIEEGSPRKGRGTAYARDSNDSTQNGDSVASNQPSQSLKIMDIIAASSSPDMKDPAVAAYYDQLSAREVVPIPARADELSLSSFPSSANRKRAGVNTDQHPVSRRYVNAASPFDVLYGAAFLHQDQERVEKTYASMSRRGQRSGSSANGGGMRQARSHNRKKKSVPKKPMTPMSSIAETEEEFAGSGVPPAEPIPSIESTDESGSLARSILFPSDKHATPPPPTMTAGPESSAASVLPMYSPTALLKSLSSYFDGTSANTLPPETSSPKGVDEMVVYRDFPRHDGTPCLMYTSKDSSPAAKNSEDYTQSREPEFDPIYTGGPTSQGFTGIQAVNLEGGGSYLEFSAGHTSTLSGHGASMDPENDDDNKSYESNASSNASSLVAGIDTFVDKLERLMEVRSQQYQDRVKADRDRAHGHVATMADREEILAIKDVAEDYEKEDVMTALVLKDNTPKYDLATSGEMHDVLDEEAVSFSVGASMSRTEEQIGIMS